MEQLPLDLKVRSAKGRDDFIVTSCNEMAASMVESWPSWPGQMRALNVTGAALSGKSHLGAVWQNMSNADRLEYVDAEIMAQTARQTHFVLENVAP